MFDGLTPLIPGQELRRVIEHADYYTERARFAWLLEKIRQMKLTHSKIASEAESRVGPAAGLTWSQLVFTDQFGPDLGCLGRLTARLERLENNIRRFQKEAGRLDHLLNS